jgi:transposase-like protein
MGRSIDSAVWDRWRDRLGRFDGSDLTVAAFCRSEGVSQAGFYQWRKKLGRSAGRQRAVARQRHRVTATPPAFVRVVPASVSPAVVVTLTNGVRVEVPSADHELVGHVVHIAGASAATGGR